ncbi:MAG: hypothetical protein DI597_19755 [Pseudoxanthomonas spadix]|nr:MAG: hypothetical protein DI597_19755 [Pseudoxanthomonas spadix]
MPAGVVRCTDGATEVTPTDSVARAQRLACGCYLGVPVARVPVGNDAIRVQSSGAMRGAISVCITSIRGFDNRTSHYEWMHFFACALTALSRASGEKLSHSFQFNPLRILNLLGTRAT